MGYSQKTPNYDLGIWQGSDTMAYQDWNQNATLIDAQMKRNADSATGANEIATEAKNVADGAAQVANSLQETVGALNTSVTHIENDIDSIFSSMNNVETEIAGLKTTVDSNNEELTTLTSEVVSVKSATSKNTSDISAINNNLDDMQESLDGAVSSVGGLTRDVQQLQTGVQVATTNAENAINTAEQAQGEVASIQADVSQLKIKTSRIGGVYDTGLTATFDTTPTPAPHFHFTNIPTSFRSKLVKVIITINGAGLGEMNKTVALKTSIGNMVAQNDTSARLETVAYIPNSPTWDILLLRDDGGTIVVDDFTINIALLGANG